MYHLKFLFRLTERAKIAKLLICIENGKIGKYAYRTLDKIEIQGKFEYISYIEQTIKILKSLLVGIFGQTTGIVCLPLSVSNLIA